MRFLILAAVLTVPLRAQTERQAPPVFHLPRFQPAPQNALPGNSQFKFATAGIPGASTPGVVVSRPAVCSIPLLRVVPGDTHDKMTLKARDVEPNLKIVAPPAPPCDDKAR